MKRQITPWPSMQPQSQRAERASEWYMLPLTSARSILFIDCLTNSESSILAVRLCARMRPPVRAFNDTELLQSSQQCRRNRRSAVRRLCLIELSEITDNNSLMGETLCFAWRFRQRRTRKPPSVCLKLTSRSRIGVIACRTHRQLRCREGNVADTRCQQLKPLVKGLYRLCRRWWFIASPRANIIVIFTFEGDGNVSFV